LEFVGHFTLFSDELALATQHPSLKGLSIKYVQLDEQTLKSIRPVGPLASLTLHENGLKSIFSSSKNRYE
jgi:hypothetical protein